MEKLIMFILDIYILAPERSHSTMQRFKQIFLEGFHECTESYELPLYSEIPYFETKNVNELLKKLYQDVNLEYGIYWNNENMDDDVKSGMAFFTNDNGLILGLTVASEKAKRYLEKLKKEFKTSTSLILFEEPPPYNTIEFKKLSKQIDQELFF